MVSHIYLSLSIYLSIYLGNTKGWPVIRLSTACCRDPDAFRGEPLGRHTATLANLHIQKAGGTAQFKNCEQHCLEARRRLDLKALGHDIWSRASGTRCGCEALFDHHWGAAELEAIQSVARAHEVQLELMTVLRDPVARVLSEYSYLLHNRGAMTQDQWDYTDRRGPRESGMFMSPLAHRLVEQSQRSHRFMPLEEFVEMAPGRHPAHNRQTRYVNGFRRAPWRPQGGCCHLTGARFVIDWFSMRTGPAGTRAMIQLMHGLERDANQSQLEESGDGLSAGLPAHRWRRTQARWAAIACAPSSLPSACSNGPTRRRRCCSGGLAGRPRGCRMPAARQSRKTRLLNVATRWHLRDSGLGQTAASTAALSQHSRLASGRAGRTAHGSACCGGSDTTFQHSGRRLAAQYDAGVARAHTKTERARHAALPLCGGAPHRGAPEASRAPHAP